MVAQVPKVLSMVRNPHYLYRMTMLLALSHLASIVSRDVLVTLMLPVILNSAKDKVCVGGGRRRRRGHSWGWHSCLAAACAAPCGAVPPPQPR